MTWSDVPDPEFPAIGVAGWVRIVLRGTALVIWIGVWFAIFLVFRVVEQLINGEDRPLTPLITQIVCRGGLILVGLQFKTRGAPMQQKGAVVANHSSWLDIFTLNASQRVYFVAKSEIAGWPGIGWLARATGTVFIRRDRRDAAAQKAVFEDRLRAGHKLLFFPEGTSSDGLRILPFKSTLFAAFFEHDLRDFTHIQPATLTYRAPKGAPADFYGWWGDTDLLAHILQILSAPTQGSVELTLHHPLPVAAFDNRKQLAEACETAVRGNLDLRL